MLRVAELCAGYGGLFMAMEQAGWPVELAWVAETDPDASGVLATHHPTVPNVGDITEAQFSAQEPVDVVAAGFPCTDVSVAGQRAGLLPGTRSGLWAHVARAVQMLRPRLVVIENVRGLLSARAHSDVEPCPWCVGDPPDEHAVRALGAVLGDLASLGFDAEWTSVSAAAVGAPHLRWRVFILAWPAADADCDPVRQQPVAVTGGDGAAVAGDDREGTGDLDLLPTPAARAGDGRGWPSEDTAARRMWAEGRRNLEDAVALLPTPTARDGKGPDAGRGVRGDGSVRTAAQWQLPRVVEALLPTPTAVHWARNATADRADPRPTTNTDGWTLADVAHADRWGNYGAAIARWGQVLGRPAPEPTEPGAKGKPRLSPRFVEWMQGLPEGYVANHVGPRAALRILGNGIVPRQGAHALSLLADALATTGKQLEVAS